MQMVLGMSLPDLSYLTSLTDMTSMTALTSLTTLTKLVRLSGLSGCQGATCATTRGPQRARRATTGMSHGLMASARVNPKVLGKAGIPRVGAIREIAVVRTLNRRFSEG